MEDDDEFGDLYTDVLRPLSAASQSPHQTSPAAPTSLHRPIDLDLNLKSNDHPASAPNSTPPHTLAPTLPLPSSHAPPRTDADGEFTDNDNDVKVKFDIEEANNGISNDDDVPGIEIPGISQNGVENSERQNRNEGQVGEEAEDDWESDSEDDLQIVLNEDNHRPMLIDGGGGDDDDDEDGDPLVIVADADASNHQGLMVEEQEWGGDDATAQMGEGGTEKKEGTGERANGAAASAATAAAAAKIGYSNHFAYHNPYHSQFKYVRPGAAPIPGSATAVAAGGPGQVRPLVNMGPAAGRGRGDWRPTGMKTAPPMQKGFHPGFGMSASGVNMAGRGLEFTLPSHKTIFDVDIDGFEEKPWKYPGVDITDFFNFGLNEESWKDYCKQLEQHRLETTMQSKIRVYESGRDQEYDPDLPPELAAATGILDVPADNTNLGKPDIGQSDLTKGPARVRPPIPTGRAIQVEGGSGERLPSIDTRPPRIRDSDAIIEIVCQDSVDDDLSAGNGDRDNDLPKEDRRGENDGAEDEMGPVDTEYFDGFREAYDSRNRELVRHEDPFMNVAHDNIPEGNGLLPFPPEAPLRYRPGSRGPTPKYPGENIGTSHEQRRRPGRTGDSSPRMTPSQSPQIRKFHDNQDEESVESMEGKRSPLSSPVIVRDARELSVEHKDAVHDELVLGDGSSAVEKEETNAVTTSDSRKDGKALYSLKTKKINSQVEQPELQEFDEEEDSRAARSSENSKARSGSSRDNKKWREGDEEVMQDRRSTCMGSMKKHPEENEQSFRRKDREGRQEMERNRMAAIGREGSYPRRDFDPSLTHDMQMKPEGFDRLKERENSDGVWQRREDEPYSRKNRIEDTRKREREHLDEIGARHRGKARESERIDRDEYLHSRKQLDNGSYRPHYDKDASSRHRERDDSLKSRYEMVDDYISKRRKDDEYVRRDHAEKDEILHGHRDLTSRRKRERDDILDQRRREDQQRIRENFDDHHPVRHKDENWSQRERGERQREREEWHRPKPHEEILSKREREEGRGAVRSGRSSEDRAWVGHARVKDEYKGSDKEYQVKDTVRHSEQLKRRERIEDESRPPHRGREDVYKRLLEAGANILMFDSLYGRTCLHYAAYYGHADCVQAILSAAQSSPIAVSWGYARFVNIRDGRGATPLHLAARQRRPECVHILLDSGALVCASTGGYGCPGSTPLHLAARGGSMDCIRELLAWGADRLHRDASGRIPYAVALKHKHGACAALLNPASAEPLVWPSPLKFISELNQEAKALLENALMEANKEREKNILKGTAYSLPSPSHSDVGADDNISEASDTELCCICFEQVCTIEVQDCGHQMCAQCTLALCCHNKPNPTTACLTPPVCPFCRSTIAHLVVVKIENQEDADRDIGDISSPKLRKARKSRNFSEGSSSFKGLSTSFSKMGGRGSGRIAAENEWIDKR